MRRIAWVGVCLVAAVAAGPAAAEEKPVDVAVLRYRLNSAVQSRGTDLANLARWCERNDHDGWAALFRARAILMRPDDKRLRKELGYVLDGKTWVWPDEAREAFRKLDPGGLVEPRSLRRQRLGKRKIGVKRFEKIASAAQAPPDASEQERDGYVALRRSAWERVVEIDALHERACRELGFVEFEGRLIRPEAKPFLEARARRQKEAQEVLTTNTSVRGSKQPGKVGRAEGDGMRVDGSLSVRDLERVARAMVHAHRGFARALRLGEAEAVEKGLIFVVVRLDQEGFLSSLMHYGDISRSDALSIISKWGAWWVGGRSVVMRKPSVDDALELATTYMCRGGARRLRKSLLDTVPKETHRNESWLYDAIAMDVTIRLTGGFAQSVSSGKGTTKHRDLSGSSSWLARARLLVELDDDPHMSGIVQRDINSLRMRETAKGYAFLQYLFERNSLKAASFAEKALLQGGAAAAEFVYGEPLEELVPAYRDWILLTVEPAGR